MDIPWIRGRVAAQAHVGLPAGTVEEEYARDGFFGRYAHLYRTHPPVGWTRIEGPLKPRAYDVSSLEAETPVDWAVDRHAVLVNADVRLAVSSLTSPMDYLYRNADHDEVLFVHRGAGRIETDFGPMPYEPGDYLLIPRGTAYRLSPTSKSFFVIVEAASEVTFPERGSLGQHAIIDPAVVQVPTPEASAWNGNGNGEYELRIRRGEGITRVFYPFNPLDVVGWKGTLAALKLNVRDLRPVLSDRYHLPPSAHTTFVMKNAVICTFVPRPLENGDPQAMKVPFYHSNIDFDEVLFYHSGEFFSRAGMRPGMITFHPQGIHHGPQPRAVERSQQLKRTEEVAVMLDTKNPLISTAAATRVELADYWTSWKLQPSEEQK